jgi:hypothetical protein
MSFELLTAVDTSIMVILHMTLSPAQQFSPRGHLFYLGYWLDSSLSKHQFPLIKTGDQKVSNVLTKPCEIQSSVLLFILICLSTLVSLDLLFILYIVSVHTQSFSSRHFPLNLSLTKISMPFYDRSVLHLCVMRHKTEMRHEQQNHRPILCFELKMSSVCAVRTRAVLIPVNNLGSFSTWQLVLLHIIVRSKCGCLLTVRYEYCLELTRY